MKILLLEDDQKTATQIMEALSEHEVSRTERSGELLERIKELSPDLLLIDFDLKEKDGLLVYREVRAMHPFKKTIMFSSSNSIPLAVQATKLGVVDFLRKPLDIPALKESVSSALRMDDLLTLDLSSLKGIEWLSGAGGALSELFSSIKRFASRPHEFCVSGEKGTDLRAVAEAVHRNSRGGAGRFVEIDLAPFNSEATEPHFFLMLRELKEDTGAVYLSGVDRVSDPFRSSIVQYVREKKSPARIIFGSCAVEGMEKLFVPPLRERREDIPAIMLAYLRTYAPQVRYIDPKALDLLMFYDFPGNYDELKGMIKAASASFPGAEVLNLKSLPVDLPFIGNTVKNKLFSKERYGLVEAREEFDRTLFDIVLSRLNGDTGAASRFLEMPHTRFSERARDLGLR